jgi:hypothetical protein
VSDARVVASADGLMKFAREWRGSGGEAGDYRNAREQRGMRGCEDASEVCWSPGRE